MTKPTKEQINRFMDEIDMLEGARSIEDQVHFIVPTILAGLLSNARFAPPEGYADIPEAYVTSARAMAAEVVRQNCVALDALDAAVGNAEDAFLALGGNPLQPNGPSEQ